MGSWYKLTYSRRLYVWLIAYSALLMGCVLFFQYRREKAFKAEELNTELQVVNRNILDLIADSQFDVVNPDLIQYQGLRVSIIDPNGRVVYDNSLDTLPNTNHLDRREIADALRDGSGYTLRRHSQSTDETYFYSARVGADGMIVRTAVPYSMSLNGLLQADRGFLWFLGGLTLVMCTLGYFATRRVGLHVQRLKKFAEKAEKGEKIYNVEPFPHDELGEISNHIVRLYASLQQATSERDREHAAALHEHQEKERIKKQLTNNINHELKTPVASMQACLETLISHPEMNEEKRSEFLSRCFSHNLRLQQLLSDVSLLTRMEDGARTIEKEKIDLSKVISNVVAERRDVADAKGFLIQNEVYKPIRIEGNRLLLESVFFNLIDNAVSYSGGDRILIQCLSDIDSKVTILVSDNGTGVAEEHLPHLFERFYRIDKGRSRAAGGTGLGLSIVKNAVQFHGGSISVSNGTNRGLCFKIKLPKCG